MKFPIFFLTLVFAVNSFADLKTSLDDVKSWAAQEHWSEDRQWRKLLHFERTAFGVMESQVDGENFFLSPNGKTDKAAELDATLSAFFSPLPEGADKYEQMIPACRFPARWSWVQEKIGNRNVTKPAAHCPRFQHFLETLRGPSVSLVFSSYYLNNPSSAFGHTFLRLNKAPAQDGKRYELLDYGMNYAAEMDTNNALMYAIKGLFGMFRGTFTTTPYYYKVREYSNAESRDLWEYELNVTPKTVDRLIEHVWELGPVQINYWYLSENCSYHMFSILEAADPNIDLLSKLKSNVIPSDTVQVAWKEPGLVRSVHFRPSIRTELLTRASQLTESEVDEVQFILKNKDVSSAFSTLPEQSRAKILDTAVDDIEFTHAFEVQKPDSEPTKWKNKLLGYRSKIDVISEPLKINPPELEKPHEAHGSVRTGLGYQSGNHSEKSYLLNYKFALHDQLDPIIGYPEYAQISFFDIRGSIEANSHAVRLDNFTLFEVISTMPSSKFQKDLSWRFGLSSDRVRNENCDFCRWTGVSGGAGKTWSLLEKPFTFLYFGLRGIAAYHEQDQTRLWLGAGPEARLRVRWTPRIISLLEVWQRLDLEGDQRWYSEKTLSTQYSWAGDQGVRLSFTDYRFDQTGSVKFFYYY
jgi:hypothetical protein